MLIVVFEDGETFSLTDGCVIAEVDSTGMDQLGNDTKFEDLDGVHVETSIYLKDLIEAYNQVHGTKIAVSNF